MNKLNDNSISLNEKWHTYKLESDPYFKFKSATGLVGKYFEPFNAQKVAKDLCENHPKYEGMKPEELLKDWSMRGAYGTRVHKEVESGILHNTKPEEDKSKFAMEWVKEYTNDFQHSILCEQIIYWKEMHVAGTIDAMVSRNGSWDLIDWKTAKNISMSSYGGKMGNHKITEGIEDCNFNHYALQLSIYRLILEEQYGLEIGDQMIVHLTDDGAFKFDTPYYKEEANKIIKNEKGEKNVTSGQPS